MNVDTLKEKLADTWSGEGGETQDIYLDNHDYR